jgi:membrane-bound serine protease (ClpP class)
MARVAFGLFLSAVLAAAVPASHSSAAPSPASGAAAGPPRVLAVDIDGPITLGTLEYLQGALARAKGEGFQALLQTLDTPGGDYEATRQIVRARLASEVPIVVWIGPAGAHAGSAGVFITLAADVAEMHPTSNIGAAHPVTGGGQDVEQAAGKDMAKKVENDAAAFVRSIAAAKGRNVDWAEKAVRESVSVTADEAVKLHVADFIAPDRYAALAKADGRTVGSRVLHLQGAVLVPHQPTVRQRALMFVADPTVVALLMMIGLLGIALEFYHPGAILPGAAGAFCVFLAFMGMHVIPVNVGAVLLLIAGVGLLVAETYVTAHGIVGLAGALCVALGLLFFVDASAPGQWSDPGALSLSPWVVWPTPVVFGGLLLFMGWKIARGHRAPLKLGAPALIGQRGEALSDLGPGGGDIFVHGEYWQARSAVPIPRGTRVRVVSVDGLVVTVVAEATATG